MDPKILIQEIAKVLEITPQAVHKKIKEQDLPIKKISNKLCFGYETAKTLISPQYKKKILSFQIVKGGVGKTTLLHSIATRANLYGANVLCIDLDQQANLTQSLGVDSRNTPVMIDLLDGSATIEDAIVSVYPGLDLLPSEIENALLDSTLLIKQLPLERIYKKIFNRLKKNYDFIFIDCPPSLGPSVTAAALSSDIVVAPVVPEKFSIKGLEILDQELKKLKENYNYAPELKIILNKFDSRTAVSHEVLESLFSNTKYKKKMYKSFIRINQEFVNVILKNNSIYDTTKPSTAKEDIDFVTKEIIGI